MWESGGPMLQMRKLRPSLPGFLKPPVWPWELPLLQPRESLPANAYLPLKRGALRALPLLDGQPWPWETSLPLGAPTEEAVLTDPTASLPRWGLLGYGSEAQLSGLCLPRPCCFERPSPT